MMGKSLSKCHRYPRWPLVKKSAGNFIWLLIGLVFLLLPIGHVRWIGLFPVAWSIFYWDCSLLPQWRYRICPAPDHLIIGNHSYPWEDFTRLEIKRTGARRLICLSSEGGKAMIEINDRVVDFDGLAQDCFFYMNRTVEPDQSAGPPANPG